MRDLDRVKVIIEHLQKLWEAYPDMRFGQLIENFVVEPKYLWFQEDDVTLRLLDLALYDVEKYGINDSEN